MNSDELQDRFLYHPPDAAKRDRHESCRRSFIALAHDLNDWVPEGQEKALAITNLEQAMFWANAAIARSA